MCISNVGFNYFSKRFFDSLKRNDSQYIVRAEVDDQEFLFFAICRSESICGQRKAVTKQCLFSGQSV